MYPARIGLTLVTAAHLYGVSHDPTNAVPHDPVSPILLLRLAIVLAAGVPSNCSPLSTCQVTARSSVSSMPPRNPMFEVPVSSTGRARTSRPVYAAAPTWLAPPMWPGAVDPVAAAYSRYGTSVP